MLIGGAKDGWVIDKVFCDYIDSSNQHMCKVRTLHENQSLVINLPVTRTKGTVGMVLRQEDMPYTKMVLSQTLL